MCFVRMPRQHHAGLIMRFGEVESACLIAFQRFAVKIALFKFWSFHKLYSDSIDIDETLFPSVMCNCDRMLSKRNKGRNSFKIGHRYLYN